MPLGTMRDVNIVRHKLIRKLAGESLFSDQMQFTFIFFFKTDGRFKPDSFDQAYKTVMTLKIKSVEMGDFGSYKCVAKNSLGETDGTIKLYRKYIYSHQ